MPKRLWLCFTDIAVCTTIFFLSPSSECPQCGKPGELAVLPIRPRSKEE